ncbi:MAG: hypothetical protein IJ713_01325 [Oscillibacter sp.]|nr:hypothetical protein [Oscillibacter sp.]
MTIEEFIIDHLTGALDVPVRAEVPADPPEEFVLVERTGSSTVNRITTTELAVQSWAASLLEAAELNETVKAAMAAMLALGEISSVHCETDYNYTDTTTKHYRYQAVFAVVHYL